MNDLISKAALLKHSRRVVEFDEGGFSMEYNAIPTEEIKNAPAVDVKSVVHGKWKRQTDYDENDNAVFECSNCMHGDVHARSAIVPFCWYCGARMEGE